MAHIALAVRDQERSRSFYETYFEFDPGTAWVAETACHYGFRSGSDPDEVRAFRDRLAGDGSRSPSSGTSPIR
jgi:catechol 2,3-dioxygenase-like lactoylglutathione lyase family enzyme